MAAAVKKLTDGVRDGMEAGFNSVVSTVTSGVSLATKIFVPTKIPDYEWSDDASGKQLSQLWRACVSAIDAASKDKSGKSDDRARLDALTAFGRAFAVAAKAKPPAAYASIGHPNAMCERLKDELIRYGNKLEAELENAFAQRRSFSKSYALILSVLIDVSRFVPNKKTFLRGNLLQWITTYFTLIVTRYQTVLTETYSAAGAAAAGADSDFPKRISAELEHALRLLVHIISNFADTRIGVSWDKALIDALIGVLNHHSSGSMAVPYSVTRSNLLHSTVNVLRSIVTTTLPSRITWNNEMAICMLNILRARPAVVVADTKSPPPAAAADEKAAASPADSSLLDAWRGDFEVQTLALRGVLELGCRHIDFATYITEETDMLQTVTEFVVRVHQHTALLPASDVSSLVSYLAPLTASAAAAATKSATTSAAGVAASPAKPRASVTGTPPPPASAKPDVKQPQKVIPKTPVGTTTADSKKAAAAAVQKTPIGTSGVRPSVVPEKKLSAAEQAALTALGNWRLPLALKRVFEIFIQMANAPAVDEADAAAAAGADAGSSGDSKTETASNRRKQSISVSTGAAATGTGSAPPAISGDDTKTGAPTGVVNTLPHTEFSSPATTIAHRILHILLQFSTAQPHTRHLFFPHPATNSAAAASAAPAAGSASGEGAELVVDPSVVASTIAIASAHDASWLLREHCIQCLKHAVHTKPALAPLVRSHELYPQLFDDTFFADEKRAKRDAERAAIEAAERQRIALERAAVKAAAEAAERERIEKERAAAKAAAQAAALALARKKKAEKEAAELELATRMAKMAAAAAQADETDDPNGSGSGGVAAMAAAAAAAQAEAAAAAAAAAAAEAAAAKVDSPIADTKLDVKESALPLAPDSPLPVPAPVPVVVDPISQIVLTAAQSQALKQHVLSLVTLTALLPQFENRPEVSWVMALIKQRASDYQFLSHSTASESPDVKQQHSLDATANAASKPGSIASTLTADETVHWIVTCCEAIRVMVQHNRLRSVHSLLRVRALTALNSLVVTASANGSAVVVAGSKAREPVHSLHRLFDSLLTAIQTSVPDPHASVFERGNGSFLDAASIGLAADACLQLLPALPLPLPVALSSSASSSAASTPTNSGGGSSGGGKPLPVAKPVLGNEKDAAGGTQPLQVTVLNNSRASISIDPAAAIEKKTAHKHNSVVMRVIDTITKIGTHSLTVRQLKTLISLMRHHTALTVAAESASAHPSPTTAGAAAAAASKGDTKTPTADSNDAALAATAAAVAAALSGPPLRTDLIAAACPAPPPATRAAYSPLLVRALEEMATRQGAHAAFHFSGDMSGLELPAIETWPANGYTFSTWIRLESYPAAAPTQQQTAPASSEDGSASSGAPIGGGGGAQFPRVFRFFTQAHGETRGVECLLTGADRKLAVQVVCLDESWSLTVKNPIPVKKWFHLAVTHSPGSIGTGVQAMPGVRHLGELSGAVGLPQTHAADRIEPQLKIYIDGVLQRMAKDVPYPEWNQQHVNSCWIGTSDGHDDCLNSQVSSFFMFDDVLSPAQITLIHAAGAGSNLVQHRAALGNKTYLNYQPHVTATATRDGTVMTVCPDQTFRYRSVALSWEVFAANVKRDAQLLPGTRTAARRSFRDTLHAVGGVSALFPLFLQLAATVEVQPAGVTTANPIGASPSDSRAFNFSLAPSVVRPVVVSAAVTPVGGKPGTAPVASSAGSSASTPVGASTPAVEDWSEFVLTHTSGGSIVDPKFFIALLKAVALFMADSPINKRFMAHRRGFSLISYQLERASAEYFSPDAVRVLESILNSVAAIPDRGQLFREMWYAIWLNPIIWCRVSNATRDLWRQRMLHAARTHYVLVRDAIESEAVPAPAAAGGAAGAAAAAAAASASSGGDDGMNSSNAGSAGCGVQRILDVMRRHLFFVAEESSVARARALYPPNEAHFGTSSAHASSASAAPAPFRPSNSVLLQVRIAFNALIRQLIARGISGAETRALLLYAHDCTDEQQQLDVLNLLLTVVLDPANVKRVRTFMIQLHNEKQASKCQDLDVFVDLLSASSSRVSVAALRNIAALLRDHSSKSDDSSDAFDIRPTEFFPVVSEFYMRYADRPMTDDLYLTLFSMMINRHVDVDNKHEFTMGGGSGSVTVVYPQIVPILFRLMKPHATRGYATAPERDDVSLLHMSILQDMKVFTVSDENRISILIQERWYEWFFDLMSAYQTRRHDKPRAGAGALKRITPPAPTPAPAASPAPAPAAAVADEKDFKLDSKSEAGATSAVAAAADVLAITLSESDRSVVYLFASTMFEDLMFYSMETADGWRAFESALCALGEYSAMKPYMDARKRAAQKEKDDAMAAAAAAALSRKPASDQKKPAPETKKVAPATPVKPATASAPPPATPSGAAAAAPATSRAHTHGHGHGAKESRPTLPVLYVVNSMLNKFSLQLRRSSEVRRASREEDMVFGHLVTNLTFALDVAQDFLLSWLVAQVSVPLDENPEVYTALEQERSDERATVWTLLGTMFGIRSLIDNVRHSKGRAPRASDVVADPKKGGKDKGKSAAGSAPNAAAAAAEAADAAYGAASNKPRADLWTTSQFCFNALLQLALCSYSPLPAIHPLLKPKLPPHLIYYQKYVVPMHSSSTGSGLPASPGASASAATAALGATIDSFTSKAGLLNKKGAFTLDTEQFALAIQFFATPNSVQALSSLLRQFVGLSAPAIASTGGSKPPTGGSAVSKQFKPADNSELEYQLTTLFRILIELYQTCANGYPDLLGPQRAYDQARAIEAEAAAARARIRAEKLAAEKAAAEKLAAEKAAAAAAAAAMAAADAMEEGDTASAAIVAVAVNSAGTTPVAAAPRPSTVAGTAARPSVTAPAAGRGTAAGVQPARGGATAPAVGRGTAPAAGRGGVQPPAAAPAGRGTTPAAGRGVGGTQPARGGAVAATAGRGTAPVAAGRGAATATGAKPATAPVAKADPKKAAPAADDKKKSGGGGFMDRMLSGADRMMSTAKAFSESLADKTLAIFEDDTTASQPAATGAAAGARPATGKAVSGAKGTPLSPPQATSSIAAAKEKEPPVVAPPPPPPAPPAPKYSASELAEYQSQLITLLADLVGLMKQLFQLTMSDVETEGRPDTASGMDDTLLSSGGGLNASRRATSAYDEKERGKNADIRFKLFFLPEIPPAPAPAASAGTAAADGKASGVDARRAWEQSVWSTLTSDKKWIDKRKYIAFHTEATELRLLSLTSSTFSRWDHFRLKDEQFRSELEEKSKAALSEARASIQFLRDHQRANEIQRLCKAGKRREADTYRAAYGWRSLYGQFKWSDRNAWGHHYAVLDDRESLERHQSIQSAPAGVATDVMPPLTSMWRLDAHENRTRQRLRLSRNPRPATHAHSCHVEALKLRGNTVRPASPMPSPNHERVAPYKHHLPPKLSDTLDDGEVMGLGLEQRIEFSCRATYVCLNLELHGTLNLSATHLFFEPDEAEYKLKLWEAVRYGWPLSTVWNVQLRRHMHRARGLEIFFQHQTNIFLYFDSEHYRNEVHSRLRTAPHPGAGACGLHYMFPRRRAKPSELAVESGVTDAWIHRRISNFEYLMQLNTLAGRSYNDIGQYPVMPWVIQDYTSDELNLSDPNTFRDLSKPIGALSPQRLAKAQTNFEFLESEGLYANFYNSLYSHAAYVTSYLMRIEPFTTAAVGHQDGKFDHPDRLFKSMAGTWEMVRDGPDLREMIPEFFYCPEVFRNVNRVSFGTTQSGVPVDTILLPKWANGSADNFVRINRAALESEYVSERLHLWIDLIFGYKQSGAAAVAAHNVFQEAAYESSARQSRSPIDQAGYESTVREAGQCPAQLFAVKHPQRMELSQVPTPRVTVFQPDAIAPASTGTGGGSTGSSEPEGYVITAEGKLGNPILYTSVVSDSTLLTVSLDRFVRIHQYEEAGSGGHVIGAGSGNWLIEPERKADSRRRLPVYEPDLTMLPSFFETSPCRRYLVSCGHWDHTFQVINTDTGRVVHSVTAHRGLVTCVAINHTPSNAQSAAATATPAGAGAGAPHSTRADQTVLATGSKDCTVMLWAILEPTAAPGATAGGKEKEKEPDKTEYSTSGTGRLVVDSKDIKISKDFRAPKAVAAASASAGKSKSAAPVAAFIDDSAPRHVLTGHDDAVTCVALNTEYDCVVSGSLDASLIVHSLRRGAYVRALYPSSTGVIRWVGISPLNGSIYALKGSWLHAWDLNGRAIASVDTEEFVYSCVLSADGQHVMTGGDKKRIIVRNALTLKVEFGLDVAAGIRCLTLTSDELHLLVGLQNGRLLVFSAPESSGSLLPVIDATPAPAALAPVQDEKHSPHTPPTAIAAAAAPAAAVESSPPAPAPTRSVKPSTTPVVVAPVAAAAVEPSPAPAAAPAPAVVAVKKKPATASATASGAAPAAKSRKPDPHAYLDD